MKKLFCLLLAATLTLGTITSAFADEFSGSAYAGYFDKYLWRGFNLSESKGVVQPGADLSYGGFTLGLWANIQTDSDLLHELDITLDYTFDANDLVSISVGNITYILEADENTNEVYVGIALNTPLAPALTVYYDWDEFSGSIFTVASVGHELALMDNLALGLGASASYLRLDSDSSGTGSSEGFMHNAEFSATLNYALTDALMISPMVLYSVPLSSKTEDLTEIDDEIMGGINLVFSF
jgi:uncharacterized protein (TIGR02001 family)